MSFFGTRRSRQTRIYRPSPTFRDRLLAGFRDYRILTLSVIGIAAGLGLLVAGLAGNPGARWRTGQLVSAGIQARVAFSVENQEETRRALNDAVRRAPVVLRQDTSLIDRLPSQLRTQLSEIANTESVTAVAPETVLAFGINPADGDAAATAYSVLRNQLRDPDDTQGNRIDELVQGFQLLTADARSPGLVDISEIDAILRSSETGEGPDLSRPIEVQDEFGQVIKPGLLSEVLLQEQLRETGRIGKNWAAAGRLAVLKPQIEIWLQSTVRGQLRRDEPLTEERLESARRNAPRKMDSYTLGEILIPAGTRLTDSHRDLLQLEYAAFEESLSSRQRALRLLGRTLLTALIVVLFGAFLRRVSQQMLRDTPRLIVFLGMCCSAVFLSCLFSRDPLRAEIIPLLAAVMVCAIVYGQTVACVAAFGLSLIISLSTIADLAHCFTLIAICVAGVLPLRRIKSRLVIIRAGFLVAFVAFATVWALGLLQQSGDTDAWKSPGLLVPALKFAGWALVCSYFVAGSLPFIEQAFGIVTDISLLELTGVSHPLLQELARRAPGTYNHSIMVASMAEAAAESIGANGLLARVGAYFHDIGKMMKPEYFIENMTDGSENPHHSLAPAMSTLIIIGHVKDGLELAEENNLPEPLHPFITQHHGTTLVEYFYREAARKADVDHRTDASESSFRYPGPKPQTRETAVLMLADAVESASRTLKEPTPKRIQSLVHEITMKRLLDGQFDECNLQMCEIRRIEDSLVKSLLAAHHGRVRYPGQKTA
ncbi:MAG: hypothetical protein RLZZ436_1372 [Planctomycetota bacterium]|jgi:putative nucleotidyltransferase with HDIG domain